MTDLDGLDGSPEAEEWFFYLLFQAVRRRDAAFAKALAQFGLDLGKWRTLSVVRRLAGCTMNELAEFTTIDRTTLTRTADQLAAAGFVERQGSAADRRLVCLVITEAGHAVFGQALDAMRGFNAVALQGVEDDELAVLKTALGKILLNITGSESRTRAILDFSRP